MASRSGTHVRRRGEVAGEHLMGGHDPQRLLHVMKRAGAALKRIDIPFALAGGMAAYARGAGLPTHDIDFVIMEEDAEVAAKALADDGLRIEWPPEDWLFKAYDGSCMVDLIFRLSGRPVTQGLLGRADELDVAALRMPVLDATDLVISWLRAFSEHHADFAGTLTSIRPLREQANWAIVAEQTRQSPFAVAFLVLLERLGVLPAESATEVDP